MTPTVVIAVPVYNGEKYLEEALQSVVDQTYEDWECHIVNNKSTDKTEKIAQEFVNKDPRFKLYTYDEFVPVGPSWNRTTDHLSPDTKYFKLLQADDWLDKEYLSEMVPLLEKYPNAGVCTSYRINGKIVDCDGLFVEDGNIFNGKELLEAHLMERIELAGSITTPLFRLETLKKVEGFPKIFDESDFHFDTQLVHHVMNVSDLAFVFKVLSYTRWHDGALTSVYCVTHNTFLDGFEKRLFKFKNVSKTIEKKYRAHRLKYAYFLFKSKLLNRKETLEWHRKYLLRPITFEEYLMSIITLNGISYRLGKLFGK